VGTHDLSSPGFPAMELICSAQPCCQCYGMAWWSGVVGLLVGARGEDVESIAGFREGPLPPDWAGRLRQRPDLPPVAVELDILRDEALAPLRDFRAAGRPAYNPGGGASHSSVRE
jgi:tRNA(Arg) A34 adenosine deaminase TadA